MHREEEKVGAPHELDALGVRNVAGEADRRRDRGPRDDLGIRRRAAGQHELDVPPNLRSAGKPSLERVEQVRVRPREDVDIGTGAAEETLRAGSRPPAGVRVEVAGIDDPKSGVSPNGRRA